MASDTAGYPTEVATVCPAGDSEEMLELVAADARLIAAAPDLLVAAQRLYAAIDLRASRKGDGPTTLGFDAVERQWFNEAFAAIQKATGGAS
jgi:hypothetical protein